MKTPILSICIATYNRADFISETLNSIIPQLDDDVELQVYDPKHMVKKEEICMHLIKRNTCRVCGSNALTPVINLGDQYLQGSFVKPGKEMPPTRKISNLTGAL